MFQLLLCGQRYFLSLRSFFLHNLDSLEIIISYKPILIVEANSCVLGDCICGNNFYARESRGNFLVLMHADEGGLKFLY